MKYVKSAKYNTPELQKKIMGPNPVKLLEELLWDHNIPENAVVCDLGSGQGADQRVSGEGIRLYRIRGRPVERPGGKSGIF